MAEALTNKSALSEAKGLEALIELAIVLAQQSDFEKVLRLVTQKAASMLHSDFALLIMV